MSCLVALKAVRCHVSRPWMVQHQACELLDEPACMVVVVVVVA
jgi:hypothetical protein